MPTTAAPVVGRASALPDLGITWSLPAFRQCEQAFGQAHELVGPLELDATADPHASYLEASDHAPL